MARAWLAFCLQFFLFTSTLCLDVSQILVPTNDGISGVLLVQAKTNKYSFNATTAKEACEAIKMRIAKLAEVETANQNGLQTCRFGWIEENIAVIPRIERNEKCGRNSSGVSVWRASVSKEFDVYCFKPAGTDGSFKTTSGRPEPTTGGRTPSNKHYPTETTHPSSMKSTSSPAYTSIFLAFNTSSTTFITSNISDSSQATTSPLSVSSSRTSPKFSTSPPSSSSHSSTHFLFQHTSTSTGHPALSETTSRASQHSLTSTGQPSLSQTTNKASHSQRTLTSTGHPALSQTTYKASHSQRTLTSTGQPSLSQTTNKVSYSYHTLTSTGHPALSQTTNKVSYSYHTLTSTGHPALSQTTYKASHSQRTLTSTGQPTLSQTTNKVSYSYHTLTSTGQPELSQTTTPNRVQSRATPKTFVIISFVLLLLLAAAGAAWYIKIKRGQQFSWRRMRTMQNIETEMWKEIIERHCLPEQTSKGNNNKKCKKIILQMEQDPDSPYENTKLCI
ncbi:lymphatic vessel endothelial hyaluronic receptor 1b [Pseudorasbora parva]|uniref:lymphatic vessel endothelial hyaluronic receptor 1b n=1 Tax=Pseudorasbora parva TaxID=51549 RepID=UPI00351E7E16